MDSCTNLFYLPFPLVSEMHFVVFLLNSFNFFFLGGADKNAVVFNKDNEQVNKIVFIYF